MSMIGFNAMNSRVSMMGNGPKQIIAPPKRSNTAGKVIGGLAAYGVAAPVVNKSVLTKVLPKINNAFKPIAEGFKNIPLFKGVVDPDKIMSIGEKLTKLSGKNKAVMVGVLALSTIATVIAGAKIGGAIQDKIKGPKMPEGLVA